MKDGYLEFKDKLCKILKLFEGFDPSAISENEFRQLYEVHVGGVSLERVARACVDGSAYDKYFRIENRRDDH